MARSPHAELSLRRGRRADDTAAAADDKKGRESGLGAVEEGPAEQEEEDSGAEISSYYVSCELTIEDIIDSYIDFYGGLSERREEPPPPIDAVLTALRHEHQTRTLLASMGRACW